MVYWHRNVLTSTFFHIKFFILNYFIFLYFFTTLSDSIIYIYIYIYIMLRAILNKSWRQHPTRHQLYCHLPPITKIIQVRRTRHAGHSFYAYTVLVSNSQRRCRYRPSPYHKYVPWGKCTLGIRRSSSCTVLSRGIPLFFYNYKTPHLDPHYFNLIRLVTSCYTYLDTIHIVCTGETNFYCVPIKFFS